MKEDDPFIFRFFGHLHSIFIADLIDLASVH